MATVIRLTSAFNEPCCYGDYRSTPPCTSALTRHDRRGPCERLTASTTVGGFNTFILDIKTQTLGSYAKERGDTEFYLLGGGRRQFRPFSHKETSVNQWRPSFVSLYYCSWDSSKRERAKYISFTYHGAEQDPPTSSTFFRHQLLTDQFTVRDVLGVFIGMR